MRLLATYLSVALVYLGAAPCQVLCTGDGHESHVLPAAAAHGHEEGLEHPHEDDETHFCGHVDPATEDSCPEEGCIDVELRVDAALVQQEESRVRGTAHFVTFLPDALILAARQAPRGAFTLSQPPPLQFSPLKGSSRLTI